MVKIVTERSIHFSTPAIDKKGKPVISKIRYNNREVEIEEVDHHRHTAGELIEVDAETAADFIARGWARTPDAALDDDVSVDPTKDPALS